MSLSRMSFNEKLLEFLKCEMRILSSEDNYKCYNDIVRTSDFLKSLIYDGYSVDEIIYGIGHIIDNICRDGIKNLESINIHINQTHKNLHTIEFKVKDEILEHEGFLRGINEIVRVTNLIRILLEKLSDTNKGEGND